MVKEFGGLSKAVSSNRNTVCPSPVTALACIAMRTALLLLGPLSQTHTSLLFLPTSYAVFTLQKTHSHHVSLHPIPLHVTLASKIVYTFCLLFLIFSDHKCPREMLYLTWQKILVWTDCDKRVQDWPLV